MFDPIDDWLRATFGNDADALVAYPSIARALGVRVQSLPPGPMPKAYDRQRFGEGGSDALAESSERLWSLVWTWEGLQRTAREERAKAEALWRMQWIDHPAPLRAGECPALCGRIYYGRGPNGRYVRKRTRAAQVLTDARVWSSALTVREGSEIRKVRYP